MKGSCGLNEKRAYPDGDLGGTGGLVLPAWERRDRFGFLNGLYLTVKDVLLAPHRFFTRMPSSVGLGQPLLFALVIGVAGAFVSWMWTLTGSSLQILLQDNLQGALKSPLYSFFVFLTSPVAVTLGVFLKAALMHLMLLILGGGKLGFEATFRVAAYAEAADVLSVLPFCGSILGLVWTLVILVVGLHGIHQDEPWKAVAAVVAPLVLCLSVVGTGLALILMGLS